MSYLCNRNRETKIDNNKVPWMSGLVSGLQNRVRRFESARNLNKRLCQNVGTTSYTNVKSYKAKLISPTSYIIQPLQLSFHNTRIFFFQSLQTHPRKIILYKLPSLLVT